jgi:hypothetical protein
MVTLFYHMCPISRMHYVLILQHEHNFHQWSTSIFCNIYMSSIIVSINNVRVSTTMQNLNNIIKQST